MSRNLNRGEGVMFTRADLGLLPANATIETPSIQTACPKCRTLVLPFEQATWPSWYNPVWIMQICHYDCTACGCVWGSSYPKGSKHATT